ncbi:MAG: PIG-L family deacetylase [Alphaproteobacteria bacterium]|nr:PIG-L family deacetylase [Alphaproteobacteria bacterium]
MFGKRILLLAPHPDDEVVGASAAIGRARAAGGEVFVAFLSTGVPDRELFWFWQRNGRAARVAQRRAESEAAARLLGFTIALFQEIPTRNLKSELAGTRARLVDLIARRQIDMVWVPAYEGAHQDHDAANFLASTFGDRVQVWEFAEYNNAGGRTHSQEFPAPNGTEIELRLREREMAAKRAALTLYGSERGNLSHIQVGREAFRPLAAYDYARPPHQGILFYQRFQWVWPRHPRVDYTRPQAVSDAIGAFRARAKT